MFLFVVSNFQYDYINKKPNENAASLGFVVA